MTSLVAPQFVDERDAARYLGVSDRQVRKERKDGRLRSYKFGASRRYRLSDLDEWAERHRDEETAA